MERREVLERCNRFQSFVNDLTVFTEIEHREAFAVCDRQQRLVDDIVALTEAERCKIAKLEMFQSVVISGC